MESDLSVLFLLHYWELNNGGIRSMVDVIETLVREKKIHAVAAYPGKRGSAITYLESIGVPCYCVKYGRRDYPLLEGMLSKGKAAIKEAVKFCISPVAMKKFDQIIKHEKINLIYSNTIVLYIGAWLNKKYSIPHIWHIREFGKEDHGLGFLMGEKTLYRQINNNTNAVIYISGSIGQKYKNHLNSSVNQYVVYDDISSSFINPKKEYNESIDSPLNLAIIGSIKKGKGQLEVIKAVELLINKGIPVFLHIGGKKTGKYYSEIKQYVLEHNLEGHVSFDGFVREVNQYRSNMDIGIVASSNEGFGRVTVEGMLSGLLMIGADAAGTSELIQDGQNGYLYKLHDTEDLALSIEKMHYNRSKMKTMALKGHVYAKENFTKGNAAEKIYRIMQEVQK